MTSKLSLKIKTLSCHKATGGKGFDEPYILVMPFTESGIVTQCYLSEVQEKITNGSIWNVDQEMILEFNENLSEMNILISLYEKDNGELYDSLKAQLESSSWPLVLSEKSEWAKTWAEIKLKAPSLIKNTAMALSATKLSLELGKLFLGALKLIGKQSLKDDDLGSILLSLDKAALESALIETKKIEFTGKESHYELVLEIGSVELL